VQGELTVLTRYRIITRKNPQTNSWEPLGVIYERELDSSNVYAFPVIGPGEEKVNWRDWDAIDKQGKSFGIFGPPLEEYDKVFADHADRYRPSEEIYTIEGDSYKEIRAKLYQRYVLDSMREQAEHPVLTYEVPVEKPLAAARAIRERKGDDE
jgi:hypothetical protein